MFITSQLSMGSIQSVDWMDWAGKDGQ